jgi:hypothetical protein
MLRLYAMLGGVTSHKDTQTEEQYYQLFKILPLNPGESGIFARA